MQNTLLLPSLPGPLRYGVVAPDSDIPIGQLELNSVLCQTEMFKIELFWHLNYVLRLNWLGWNEIVYMYKNGFGIK